MMIADAGEHGNPLLLANPAFLELTGYDLLEVVGKDCRFLQGPETSKEALAEIRAGMNAGSDINVTLLNYRKDGSSFWNQLHVSPVRDDQGKILHYFASQLDVTETRRIASLEASERRLLKEVDHRAKNLMAVVSSIVRLSKSDNPERYAASVRARVQTLADVHTLLAEKGWGSVSLDELFSQQFSDYGPSKIILNGPTITVDATDAQPVALIIHELAANAEIHGALAATGGIIDLTWKRIEPGGFEVLWQERGGAKPSATRKTGFGTVMLDALVERQLKGSIRREWLVGGLKLTIRLPSGNTAHPLS